MSLQEYDPLNDGDTPLNDRKKVKAKKVQGNKAEEDRRATLKRLLDVKDGRHLVWWILQQAYHGKMTLERPIQGRPVDPLATMFNEGMRYVADSLFREILKVSPERYAQMETESKEITDAG